VRAPVSVDGFRQFLPVLEAKDVEATNANIGGFSLFYNELGFGLSEWLSASFKGVVMQEAEGRQSQMASFTFQRKLGEWQLKRKRDVCSISFSVHFLGDICDMWSHRSPPCSAPTLSDDPLLSHLFISRKLPQCSEH
jgi:ribosome-associated toxin RatA of RatAB toxin-antitoxin module